MTDDKEQKKYMKPEAVRIYKPGQAGAISCATGTTVTTPPGSGCSGGFGNAGGCGFGLWGSRQCSSGGYPRP